MKVYELFESKKQEGRRDKAVLKKDYLRWKKLVNMPIRFIQASAGSLEAGKTGLTPRELKARMQYSMPKIAAKAILRMKNTPVSQWTTIDINWMYRTLSYIDGKLSKRGEFLADKKPTEKLKNLWAFGHVPNGLRPRVLKD